MSYDIITKDLCRKAEQDCRAAVERTAMLLDDPADKMMVAISASAGSLAAAAGYAAALTKQAKGNDVEPAVVVDALWEMIRPLILTTAGGDRAPFERLLAGVRP